MEEKNLKIQKKSTIEKVELKKYFNFYIYISNFSELQKNYKYTHFRLNQLTHAKNRIKKERKEKELVFHRKW